MPEGALKPSRIKMANAQATSRRMLNKDKSFGGAAVVAVGLLLGLSIVLTRRP